MNPRDRYLILRYSPSQGCEVVDTVDCVGFKAAEAYLRETYLGASAEGERYVIVDCTDKTIRTYAVAYQRDLVMI